MNPKVLFGGMAIVVIVIACLGLGGSAGTLGALNPQVETTQGEEIKMIQPLNGIWAWVMLEKEAYAAQEVNVPNSQANENNSQAHLNEAQAALALAKAEALQKEAARLNNEQFNQGKVNGAFLGGIGGICLGVLGVVALLIGLVWLTSRAAGGGVG